MASMGPTSPSCYNCGFAAAAGAYRCPNCGVRRPGLPAGRAYRLTLVRRAVTAVLAVVLLLVIAVVVLAA